MKQEELVEEVVDASSLAAGIGPSNEPRKKEEELVKFYRSSNPQMRAHIIMLQVWRKIQK
jgi:hypothetical protein